MSDVEKTGRENGFYWVQQRGASEPEVARWEHECWWVTGEKRQLLDEEVRVLSGFRLKCRVVYRGETDFSP